MGQIGDEQAILPLIVAIKDNDSSVRKAATRALQKLGKPAVEPLTSIFFETVVDEQRKNIAIALSKIGGKRAMDILISSANARNHHHRGAALGALGQTGDARELEPLAKAIEISWTAEDLKGIFKGLDVFV